MHFRMSQILRHVASWLLALPVPDPELACEIYVWACLLLALSQWKGLTMFRKLLHDRRGVSSMEYGVLAIAVLGAVVAGLLLLTPQITALFGGVADAIAAAIAHA